MKDKYYCGKYYCGKCKHIGIYTGRCAHSEKICKLYAEILKVDDNGVEKCVPCVCKTLETENVALRERLKKAVELPAKIGDKVYMPWVYGGESGIAECEVYHIALFKDRNDRILIVTDLKSDNIDFKRKYNYGQFMLRDFGVKLFTAPEAALARLAELNGGKK